MDDLETRIYGCLLGGLIGDAMGAPVEGKSYTQIETTYGPEGVSDFEGTGTDDTAIREQLIHSLLACGGYVTCDEFAGSFLTYWNDNYAKWWVPVRNMAHKVRCGVSLPVDAGYGNTPSSSSAMAIAPMGIVNAMNPRQAALETFDVAGLIHSGPSGFCRDAACAMAAAIAEALRPNTSVNDVQDAAIRYLHPTSAREMIGCIERVRELAKVYPNYTSFREACYTGVLRLDTCDSRETVPVALALFGMAGEDPARAIRHAVNFGRDADTIGTMVGGLSGAFRGASSLPQDWVRKVEANPKVGYRLTASRLAELVRSRARRSLDIARLLLADSSSAAGA